MSWIAVGLFAAYVAVTFGLRSYVQWRRTGSTGFVGISGSPRSVEWWAGVLLVVVALGAWALAFLAIELQVRCVEERHLLRTHGDAYRRYAGAVGRFVPGLGRLPPA